MKPERTFTPRESKFIAALLRAKAKEHLVASRSSLLKKRHHQRKAREMGQLADYIETGNRPLPPK